MFTPITFATVDITNADVAASSRRRHFNHQEVTMRLHGQTAVVTGAGRGIGLAIAAELAAQGCNVAMVARTRFELEEAAAIVNKCGPGRAMAIVADVRDLEAITTAVAATEKKLGPVTALINNAGTPGPAGYEWEVDPDDWWQCIETIVRGAFNATRAVLPAMLDRGAGRIIDIASITGLTGWPLVSATSLAKTALIRRIENLAAVCAGEGIHAFALHPGMVRTRLLLSYRSNPDLKEFLDTAPTEAFSPPELSGHVTARIVAGELDALSGRFIDATDDLDELCRRANTFADQTLTLRLVTR
jgi:NAD(P)-dependent dehydrogenase (short-subunit alcohol dehydrogenase family)